MLSFFRTTRVFMKRDCRYVHIKCSNKTLLNKYSFVDCHGYSYSSLSYTNKHLLRKLKYCFLYRCSYFNDGGSHQDSVLEELDTSEGRMELFLLDDGLPQASIRNLLYPDSTDPIIIKLTECSSILQVLDFLYDRDDIDHKHLAQALLVLWDLQKMFYYGHYHINKILPSNSSTTQYNSQVTSHPKFLRLVEQIEAQCTSFDVESLSCAFLYLHKIGLEMKHPVMQLIIMQLKGFLKTNLSLNALSRFVVALFSEFNLGSFFIMQDAIPILVGEIDKCDTVEDLKLITICMMHLQQMISDDVLDKYRNKVLEFKNNNKFVPKDYRALLKIITFLSYPQWNNNNAVLVSEIMLVLKNHLHMLSVFDFFVFYEVFYKNQEPGELLTEIQRCGSRLLLHLGDDTDLPIDVKIKLLTSIVCFSSPVQRSGYEKLALQCIEEPLSKQSIFEMLKILTFIKPDIHLSQKFWNNVMKCVASQKMYLDIDFLLVLCHKYMNYNNDVQYRHREFETWMLGLLKTELDNGITALIPSNISLMSGFILAYSEDRKLIDYVTQKLNDSWEQLNHIDCLYISKGIRSVVEITKNPFVRKSHLNMINNNIDKAITERLILKEDTMQLNFLIKSNIYRKRHEQKLFNSLSHAFDCNPQLSSNSIRNLLYSLQTSSTLLPNFMENISDYVINHKDHLLGFNAEKVAYFCYFLGYLPKKSDELFQTITDLIIRDQERISGLSYLQAGLALCFFNKLPDSFIRRIFNVNFLEKLDVELAKCYSKDIYPIRVRKTMMQLNRAVCLDYPQINIPWFHQKFIDDMQKEEKSYFKENNIARVKSYLVQLVEDRDYISEDVYSAYGYQMDFLLHFDSNGNLIKADNYDQGTRVALLLQNRNAYTNTNIQLKGQYQLKTRHLEILGYKVVHINLTEWNSLLYGKEKLDYICNLIWPCNTINSCPSTLDKEILKN